MKLVRAALAITALLFVAGCLPVTSKTPIGTTAGLGVDPALVGTWKGHSADPDDRDKGYGYFHFLKATDGSFAALMVISQGNDDDWTAFNLGAATLGKNHFLNAVETFDNNKPADDSMKDVNIPLLYTIKGKRLTLYMLDEDKTKKAIQAGEIAGTVEAGESGDVKLTADAAALDAFMAKPEAAKLFKAFMVLRKAE